MKPELKHLSGSYYSNFTLLFLIMLFSISSLGLGDSIMNYMSKKMESPFISYIYVSIPNRNKINLNDELMNEQFHSWIGNSDYDYKSYFSIASSPFPEYRSIVSFKHHNSNNTSNALVKLTSLDDPILEFMINKGLIPSNLTWNSNSVGEIGCIVTKGFLEKDLKYFDAENSSPEFLLLKQIDASHGDFYNPIPIRCIVDQLPDGIDVLMGNGAYNISENTVIHQSLCCDNQLIINSEGDTLQKPTKNIHKDYVYIPAGNSTPPPTWTKKPWTMDRFKSRTNSAGNIFPLNEDSSYYELNKDNDELIFIYDYYTGLGNELVAEADSSTREVFAFKFMPNQLQKATEFSVFLDERLNLDVNMRVIENKNNFNTMNNLVQILSYSLIFFSILSLIVFKTSLFANHISRNIKNLGTLKAFGMANKEIILIYSSICICIIAASFISALLVSELIGNYLIDYIANWFGIVERTKLSYNSVNVFYLLFYFVITPIIIVFLKLNNILRNTTPGNLIYER